MPADSNKFYPYWLYYQVINTVYHYMYALDQNSDLAKNKTIRKQYRFSCPQ